MLKNVGQKDQIGLLVCSQRCGQTAHTQVEASLAPFVKVLLIVIVSAYGAARICKWQKVPPSAAPNFKYAHAIESTKMAPRKTKTPFCQRPLNIIERRHRVSGTLVYPPIVSFIEVFGRVGVKTRVCSQQPTAQTQNGREWEPIAVDPCNDAGRIGAAKARPGL